MTNDNPDPSTADYYAAHAADCAARYESARVDVLHDLLQTLVRNQPRALDIGGGSGRDAAFLAHLSCDTTYTDACREMLDQAVRRHPELANQAKRAAFPLPPHDDLLDQRFDLILAAGLIMHFDDDCLERFARQVARLLATGGQLVISHSNGRQCGASQRDALGRRFIERPASVVEAVFEQAGLTAVKRIDNPDGLGRTQLIWTTHVLKKNA